MIWFDVVEGTVTFKIYNDFKENEYLHQKFVEDEKYVLYDNF